MRTIEEEELMVVCKNCGRKLMVVKRDLEYTSLNYNGKNMTIRYLITDSNNPETGYYFNCICCHINNHIRRNDHREIEFFGIKV